MTYPLITQAQQIIQAAIDDPTAPPTVVAWQAANAIVEEGWTPPPGGDVVEQAARALRGSPLSSRGDSHWRRLAARLADAGLLRTPPQQDDPWGGASLAKCGDKACRCSREPTDD